MRGVIVENLVKSYVSREGFKKKRIVEALRGVSFSASSGEIHALLGPNGAGKTTLIKILATLLLPDSGVAYVDGYNVVSQADDVRRVIGVVLDVSKGFYTSLTGFENLVFYAMLKGYTYSDAKRRTREVLELVGLWDMGVHNRPYYTYSLGMRARLSIAKALLTDPRVLLLDEPTLGLDVESAKMVRRLIVDLAKEGRTVLITGHNMFEIEQIATSISIINGGRIVASGAPQDLKQRLGLLHKVVIRVEGRAREFLSRISKTIEISSAVVEELGGVSRITFYAKASREDVIQTVLEALSLLSARMVDFVFEEPTLEDAYIAVVSGGHSAEHS
uniref:ABC transporter ATP-binding protein n=1 Tax=Ignisphaera aggregans TaxID=334771 RepID=A0A7J3Z6V1_9CREN